MMTGNQIAIATLASFALAGSFVITAIVGTRLHNRNPERRQRRDEAIACAVAASCVQAVRDEFGSYNDLHVTEAEDFEFFKQMYLEEINSQ